MSQSAPTTAGLTPEGAGGLQAELRYERDEFSLEVQLDVPPGQITGLFGHSGAGKTTFLRCLAGLEPCQGSIQVGGEAWLSETASLPPHERRVGYVFQSAALFPHLDVAGNLAFAERRAPPNAVLKRADVVAWLGLKDLLQRGPETLSGGQAQRVAIARALLAGPRLLLLDEPVAALDLAARSEVLGHLEAIHQRLELPIVYVSHTPGDLARLADHLVWLEAGKVRAQGPAAEMLGGLELGAELGEEALSVVRAEIVAHDEAHHLTELSCPWGTLWVRRHAGEPGAEVRARIWARDVSIDLDPPGRSSALNVLEVEVQEIRARPPAEALVRLGSSESPTSILARITTRSREALGLEVGTRVFARIKTVSLGPRRALPSLTRDSP